MNMKKIAVLFALLIVALCIIPCCAEDNVLLIAPATPPIAPTPADFLPEKEDMPLIGEAVVGNDAPIAPNPDTPIEHPIAPDAGASFEGEDIVLVAPGADAVDGILSAEKSEIATDSDLDYVPTTGAVMPQAPEADESDFIFEPANFVSNLYYMGVGMVGIFIVIGIIVLATLALNKIFSDKAKEND